VRERNLSLREWTEPLSHELKIHEVVTGSSGRVYLVREGAECDSAAVYRYKNRVFNETEWLLQAWEDFETDPEREAFFLRRFQASPNSIMLVAFDGADVIGTITLLGGPYRRTQHVASLGLGVIQSWWSNGVGTRLLELGLEWARQNPLLSKVNLQVYHTNERAITLYERYGFQREGCLKRDVRLDDGTEVDLVLMSLYLDGESAGENT